jgi:hypothetical protein
MGFGLSADIQFCDVREEIRMLGMQRTQYPHLVSQLSVTARN